MKTLAYCADDEKIPKSTPAVNVVKLFPSLLKKWLNNIDWQVFLVESNISFSKAGSYLSGAPVRRSPLGRKDLPALSAYPAVSTIKK